jgi:hypothetical protein
MRKNITIGVAAWFLVSIPTGLIVGRVLRRNEERLAAYRNLANTAPTPREQRPFVAAR